MGKAGKLIDQQQDAAIWEGIQQFSEFPDWLASLRDTTRVCAELAKVVPEFHTGQFELRDCTVGHIRYKSGNFIAFYKLTVRQADDPTDRSLLLQGKIFPPGKYPGDQTFVSGRLGDADWRAVLPALELELQTREPESTLGALSLLTNPVEARQFLEDMLRSKSPAFRNIKIKGCTPQVVRYNPGSRCTILYHLEYETGPGRDQTWPELVVAKTYHEEKGETAFASMSALWNSSLGSGRIVKLAEPLGYQPENKILVQGPVHEEQTLRNLITTTVETPTPERMDELSGYMRKTAAGLAALHDSGVKSGQRWGWEDQMREEVQRPLRRLAAVLPQLATAGQPLIDRLNRLAAGSPPDSLVPSHGTFRPMQVLLYQGEIGFIDFDSFRQSEPADDLALFLGEMFNIGLAPSKNNVEGKIRKPLDPSTLKVRFDFMMAFHEKFVEEYQKYRPVSYQRVALWEALDMLTFVIHAWTKNKMGELESFIYLLEHFLLATRIIDPQ